MLKIKKEKCGDLLALFLIGIGLVAIFFTGGNLSLLNQNITHWPKTEAKVASIDRDNICEPPESSGACYDVFFVKYLYTVNDKEYTNQLRETFLTNYSLGKKFEVYYKKDNPQVVFTKEEFPTRSDLYLPLILGSVIIIIVIILKNLKGGSSGDRTLNY